MQIEKLEHLLKHATPAPWNVEVTDELYSRGLISRPGGGQLGYMLDDLQLICALRNDAQKIINVLKELKLFISRELYEDTDGYHFKKYSQFIEIDELCKSFKELEEE